MWRLMERPIRAEVERPPVSNVATTCPHGNLRLVAFAIGSARRTGEH